MERELCFSANEGAPIIFPNRRIHNCKDEQKQRFQKLGIERSIYNQFGCRHSVITV